MENLVLYFAAVSPSVVGAEQSALRIRAEWRIFCKFTLIPYALLSGEI